MDGPLKWFGGKSYLAKRIVALFPRHLHYVEAYAGGLAVLLERDPNDESLWVSTDGNRGGVSEVANDLNAELVNFWRVLRDEAAFRSFSRLANAIPLSRKEFEDACASRRDVVVDFPAMLSEGRCYVPAAVDFFVCCRQSRAGSFTGFTSLTRSRTRRGVNGNASEWLSAVEGLPAVHARLRPVVIERMPALDLVRREDATETLFYLDPPYLHSTRTTTDGYACEMTEQDHADLLEVLGTLEGKFILSGYRSDLYDTAAVKYGWRRVDIDIANHAAGGKAKRRMTECLWMNYHVDAPAAGREGTP
jgi:DNA adenine methylase